MKLDFDFARSIREAGLKSINETGRCNVSKQRKVKRATDAFRIVIQLDRAHGPEDEAFDDPIEERIDEVQFKATDADADAVFLEIQAAISDVLVKHGLAEKGTL